MNTLDELSGYLRDRAAAADLGHTPIGVITRAGLRRRNRHRAVATAGLLTAGTVTAIASTQLLASGGGKRVSTGPVAPDSTTAAPDTSAIAAPSVSPAIVAATEPTGSPLVWNGVEVDFTETLSSLTWISDTTSNGELGPYYRASSAPGRSTSEEPGTYRSDDGIHWSYLGPTDPDRPAAIYNGRSVGSVGGRRYVMDTPFVDPGSEALSLTAAQSDDGITWVDVSLPFDLAGLANESGVGGVSVSAGGVAGHGGTVALGAVVSTQVTERSVAAAIGAPGSVGYDETGNGFIQYETTPIDCDELHQLMNDWMATTRQIESDAQAAGTVSDPFPARPGDEYGADQCVRWGAELRRISADDVGLSEQAAAAGRGLPVVFVSTDGGDFARAAAPAVPDGEQIGRFMIVADDDGYVAVMATTRGVRSYRSDSTLTAWHRIGDASAPTERGYTDLSAVGRAGDRVVAVLNASNGAPQVSTLEGEQWTATDITALVPASDVRQWNQGAIGTNGVALVGSVYPPSEQAPPVLVYSPDGITWSVTDLATLTETGNHLVTGLMLTGSQVLITVREMTDLVDRDAPLPGSTVLVGTLR